MVTRGDIIDNQAKLFDMRQFLELLINLHQTALFTWKIDGVDYYLPEEDIDALVARYQTLKTQLETKYGELL